MVMGLSPWWIHTDRWHKQSLIARFMGPAWGPSGADRTQVGPMLAPWTLLSWVIFWGGWFCLVFIISNVAQCCQFDPTISECFNNTSVSFANFYDIIIFYIVHKGWYFTCFGSIMSKNKYISHRCRLLHVISLIRIVTAISCVSVTVSEDVENPQSTCPSCCIVSTVCRIPDFWQKSSTFMGWKRGK